MGCVAGEGLLLESVMLLTTRGLGFHFQLAAMYDEGPLSLAEPAGDQIQKR